MVKLIFNPFTFRYYHRTLNPKKLVATGFTSLPRHQTMSSMIKATAVPSELSIPGLREMRDDDVQQVSSLIRNYMSRYDISPLFSVDEVRHNFISGMGEGDITNGRRKGQVTWSYVVEVRRIARQRSWSIVVDCLYTRTPRLGRLQTSFPSITCLQPPSRPNRSSTQLTYSTMLPLPLRYPPHPMDQLLPLHLRHGKTSRLQNDLS